jgi:Domain of unknown function DUF1828
MSICEEINRSVGALFTCRDEGDFVRLRTPFLYPDGDVIDLFARVTGEVMTLTDLGETLRWLRMQTLSQRRSPKQQQLIQDVIVTHGVEFYRGMLNVRVESVEQVSPAVMRLAQAALRIADIWFTFRTRAVESVADEVADYFAEKDIPFDRRQQLIGRSGKPWRPDFHTRLPQRSALINVLSTGSRTMARGVVEHVVTQWHDLSYLKMGPESLKFVSLFDDTVDVWSESDRALVGDFSEIALWSQPDELLDLIAA